MREAECPFCERVVLVYEEPPRCPLCACPLDEADAFPERVVAAASPIDDVRGTAAYRAHALGVLARRALARCLA